MKTLTKQEITQAELVSVLLKSLSAQYLLEKQELEEATERLRLALHASYALFQEKREPLLIPIAHEILHDSTRAWGENWSAPHRPKRDVSIVRQLLPLHEYIRLVADALNALLLWNDQAYAKKQLEASLRSLSYEVVSLSF